MNWNPRASEILPVLTLALAIFATGCLTTTSRTRRYNRSNAAVSTYLRRHDEQITNLTFQNNQFKEREADIIRSLNALNKRIARLSTENVEIKKKLATMSRTLATESAERKTELDGLLKEVSKQTATAMDAAAKARAAAIAERTSRTQKNSSRRGPAMKGEFYVYTVERGATLSAIAKAYKVSVSDIKKANRLTRDNIRVGQKLYIPKK